MNQPLKNTDFSKVAQGLIDAYARDPEGLTLRECRDLGLDEAEAEAWIKALQTGAGGMIALEEEHNLMSVGADQSVVREIAGEDGSRALRERVKWLSDAGETRWYRWDYSDAIRSGMHDELREIERDPEAHFTLADNDTIAREADLLIDDLARYDEDFGRIAGMLKDRYGYCPSDDNVKIERLFRITMFHRLSQVMLSDAQIEALAVIAGSGGEHSLTRRCFAVHCLGTQLRNFEPTPAAVDALIRIALDPSGTPDVSKAAFRQLRPFWTDGLLTTNAILIADKLLTVYDQQGTIPQNLRDEIQTIVCRTKTHHYLPQHLDKGIERRWSQDLAFPDVSLPVLGRPRIYFRSPELLRRDLPSFDSYQRRILIDELKREIIAHPCNIKDISAAVRMLEMMGEEGAHALRDSTVREALREIVIYHHDEELKKYTILIRPRETVEIDKAFSRTTGESLLTAFDRLRISSVGRTPWGRTAPSCKRLYDGAP